MEWTKYVLACTLGVCMLILFGRRDEGRDKWIFGLAVGGSLAAMELTVEYMYHKELWVMASSVMKSLALFSLIVLAGYGWEWIRSHKREDNEQEPGASGPTMDRRVSGEFCSAFPQLLHDTPDDAGDQTEESYCFSGGWQKTGSQQPGKSGKWVPYWKEPWNGSMGQKKMCRWSRRLESGFALWE